MDFIRTTLRETLSIRQIITMYYFEFARNYVFHGERHDFWELVYADKGEITVGADEETRVLESGSVIFHKPNEFHSFHASSGTAPNIIVVTFDCPSEAMRRFEGRVCRLRDEERNLLSGVIKEGMRAFRYPFEHPLVRREDAPVGAEQRLGIYLELLLLELLGRMDEPREEEAERLLTPAQAKENAELVRHVIAYMERHIGRTLTLEEISREARVTKTRLKEAFKRQTGYAVMHYFIRLRIDRAKTAIREQAANFSEISEMLGFSSVHVFSRTFKKTTGMTPTEYARSVQARV
ncbi:AraC family transcriptional regulator [Cohnella nanjingensis]|uniref:Helix-turn-helix transcriptional regulator n=1 Tax=Cohnella nanjingensis TaxID=1387779 RepID=A0A7X0VJC1_9BACL|nr:AraC family transcriptional regulator [Cohnella nanjingensis]MBB6674559.1 helix-turn-helix transcriptional regulator [Cohnella nanjingensis]